MPPPLYLILPLFALLLIRLAVDAARQDRRYAALLAAVETYEAPGGSSALAWLELQALIERARLSLGAPVDVLRRRVNAVDPDAKRVALLHLSLALRQPVAALLLSLPLGEARARTFEDQACSIRATEAAVGRLYTRLKIAERDIAQRLIEENEAERVRVLGYNYPRHPSVPPHRRTPRQRRHL